MATSGAFCRTIWRRLARQLFIGKHWYSQSEPIKLFSELRDLHPSIVEKLTQQKLLELTDIQRKSLPDLLSERSYSSSCIINAETGSGKTLCFLLPILQLLTKHSVVEKENPIPIPIPVPSSLVLVPTPHLAHQIEDVFQSLALPGWGSSLSHKGSKLTLKANSHLLIATPSSLGSFNVSKLLKHIRILCVDEADVLLTGGDRQMTWSILEEMRNHYRNDVRNLQRRPLLTDEGAPNNNDLRSNTVTVNQGSSDDSAAYSGVHRQIIFTAATLPSRGRESVQAQLMRWVPKNTLFFNTDHTHQVISLARMKFVDVRDREQPKEDDGAVTKFEQLIEDLLSLRNSSSIDDSSQIESIQLPKVLVFANTVASAEEIFSYLERTTLERGEGVWWMGKIGKLHKLSSASTEEKEKTLRDFRNGSCRVLVSTDLASRGLDLPDVTAVIQVDFPVNSADFLHRAGRTARAGKSGTVISYIGETDRDLAREVRGVVEDKSKSFNSIFSRNKMLRRRINRRIKAAASQRSADEYS